jgi:hypothetical protein
MLQCSIGSETGNSMQQCRLCNQMHFSYKSVLAVNMHSELYSRIFTHTHMQAHAHTKVHSFKENSEVISSTFEHIMKIFFTF